MKREETKIIRKKEKTKIEENKAKQAKKEKNKSENVECDEKSYYKNHKKMRDLI